MGRAIVRNPKVFLFDEPLSNLDAKLRAELRRELPRTHHHLLRTLHIGNHHQEPLHRSFSSHIRHQCIRKPSCARQPA